jgi:hypothetical protein
MYFKCYQLSMRTAGSSSAKRLKMETVQLYHLVAELRMSGNTPPLHHMTLWGAQGHIYVQSV